MRTKTQDCRRCYLLIHSQILRQASYPALAATNFNEPSYNIRLIYQVHHQTRTMPCNFHNVEQIGIKFGIRQHYFILDIISYHRTHTKANSIDYM